MVAAFCIQWNGLLLVSKIAKHAIWKNDDELVNIRVRQMRISMESLLKRVPDNRKCSRNNKSAVRRCEKSTPAESPHFFENTVRNTVSEISSPGLEGSLQEAASKRGWTGLTEQVRQYNAKRPTRESEDEGYTRPRSIRVHSILYPYGCV